MYAIHQDLVQRESYHYCDLVRQEERWIDFKQHWNTHLKRLYWVVSPEEFNDGTDDTTVYRRQRKEHKKAKKEDDSVRAKSVAYMDTKYHEIFMTEIKDGEKKQLIEEQMLNNISKLTYTLSGDCSGGENHFKQFQNVLRKGELKCRYELPEAVCMEKAIQGFLKLNLPKGDLNKAYAEWMEIAGTLKEDKSNWKQAMKKDFDKSDTYDGIEKLTNKGNKEAIQEVLKYIENYKHTSMPNGAEYYFKLMENIFEALKQIDNYVTPIELRMRVTATQFCNCEHEGILMYAIHKNWVENQHTDNDRMREQDWIDFKQHWNESLQDIYRENRRLKEKAEAGDKSQKLEGMLDQIWKLKLCPKKGVKYYFSKFDALWEENHSTCHYDVPPEICMQKATCAILKADLPWNMTYQANLDWWNRMKKINVENNTKDLAGDIVGDKRGDKNKDEINLFFNANGDDSDIDNNDKDNDKDNNGRDQTKAPHGWNKVCERCANKNFKKKCEQCQETCRKCTGESGFLCCIKYETCARVPAKKRGRPSGSKNSNKRKSPKKKKVKKAEEASNEGTKSGNPQNRRKKDPQVYSNSKQALKILDQIGGPNTRTSSTKIAASHNMTVEELLVANNILKDDNPENLLEEKIQRPGIKKLNYRDFSSDDDSNEKKETEDEIESGKQEGGRGKENEEEAASETEPIEVATDPTYNSNEKEETEDEIESDKEVDESPKKRRTHREEEDKKNQEEVASEMDPIAVAMDPVLQKGDTENIEEKAAKVMEPIENKERKEKQDKMERLFTNEEDKKNEEEVANNTVQIAVATDPTLQEDDKDKNKEAAANDTNPIAVAADPALQDEDDTESMEEEAASETDPIED
eukprot:jgi/Psemu1/41912/gm1.41912_g